MVKFYFLDKATFGANRDKYGLPTADLINWCKSVSKMYVFSPEFNKTFIVGNPKIGHIIGGKALESNLLGPTDSTDFAYFYLDSWFARSIYRELETLDLSGFSKEGDTFRDLLTAIRDKAGSCIVEFAKKEAWFDYDDTLRKQMAMQKEVEEMVRKARLGGNQHH